MLLSVEKVYYLDLSDGVQVQTEDDKVKLCARNANTLPKWGAGRSCLFSLVLVWLRVFSLLNSNFSKDEEAALEETVETSIMLKYNYIQRDKSE